MDAADKLTDALGHVLDTHGDADEIEIVVELTPAPPPTGSRAERMDSLKSHFEQVAPSVVEVIEQAGGTVLDGAWINATLHGSLPVGSVKRVAGASGVRRIDSPQPLRHEAQAS